MVVGWVAGHRRVNERAGTYARSMAESGARRTDRTNRISLAFLGRRSSKRATQQWRLDILWRQGTRAGGSSDCRGQQPNQGSDPSYARPRRCGYKVLPAAEWARYDCAPSSGRSGGGWRETLVGGATGVDSRVHLFKECAAWTDEIRTLWGEVGEASGQRENQEDVDNVMKCREGFGFRVKSARA